MVCVLASILSASKYGKKKSTHIWHVPFTARYRYKRTSFRVTVPSLNITRPLNVRTQGGVIIPNQNDNTPIGRAKRVTQRGLGDTSLALTYNLFYHRRSRTRISITGRLKVPTGNTALGLGTGKVGYAVQTNLYKARGRFNFSTLFGYRMPGSPTGIKFSNTFYGAAGIGYRTSRRLKRVFMNCGRKGISSRFRLGGGFALTMDDLAPLNEERKFRPMASKGVATCL